MTRTFSLAAFFVLLAPLTLLAQGPAAFQYQYPANGSECVSPQSNLILRPGATIDASTVQSQLFDVVGSVSGKHDGRARLSDDGKTILFRPTTPFVKGEIVNVRMREGVLTSNGTPIASARYAFKVSETDPMYQQTTSSAPSIAAPLLTGFPQPFLDTLPANFPAIQPSVIATAGEDPLYFSPFRLDAPSPLYHPTMEITTDTGRPLFWREMPSPSLDLKLHWNGLLTYFSTARNMFFVMNSKFEVVDSIATVGYLTDGHDIEFLRNGHTLLFALDIVPGYDVSQLIGGPPDTVRVEGVVVQELDQNKEVVFNWRGFDPGRFQYSDVLRPQETKNGVLDVTHTNSIELDNDGNITISNRCMSEITKIDRQTGEILWRFGGKKNQFTLVGDTLWFDYQHCFRRLPNGHVMMYDNGNKNGFARAVEYILDETNKKATLAWQFDRGRTVPSIAMGSVQRFANGNTLIGWGLVPNKTIAFTEVSANNDIVYEADMPAAAWANYRVFRMPFPGTADVAPARASSIALSGVYPNPALGQATLQIDLPETVIASVKIVDALGNSTIVAPESRLIAGRHNFTIDCKSLAAGVYFAVMQAGAEVRTARFIVAH
jgi:hypothetical protein